MEQTLGNITHYMNLRRQESQGGGKKHWLPIDYRASRLPWSVAGSIDARKALSAVIDEVDGVFIHTTTLALGSPSAFGKKTIVLSSDATPAGKSRMRGQYGMRAESRFGAAAKRSLYRAIFRGCDGFVTWSTWAKQSFVDDYGCREEDVVVIPPGIDLRDFAPGDRNHDLPRILFVGGDFVRKGGDLLLQVFNARLRGRAELILVTNEAIPKQPGVRTLNDVAPNSPRLLELYASSDIFALPTRADCYSLVCMEALAAGLPLVTTTVGGLGDMVNEGKTGHLMAPDDATALGDILESLTTNPTRRAAFGEAGRQDARRRFDAGTNARQLFEFVRSRC